ncbi:MAG: hypothetical protein IPI48_14400 [bacterium]|nr:hypothetical protein [bacterium]
MRASCGMLLVALACLAPLGVPASVAAQEFTFEFQLTIGGATSGWHTFGLREDALPGIDAPWMIQFLELRLDSSVATGNSTWGGVKGLFR